VKFQKTVFLLVLSISAAVCSQELPPWSGLPDKLPSDFMTREFFVPFTQTPETFHAPIAASIVLNDKPVPPRDLATMSLVFEEAFAARLPRGQSIQVKKDSQNRKVWDYPIGTRVVHAIHFRTLPPQVFEIRLEQKMEGGRWAFGLYTPAGNGLELNRYGGMRPETYSFKLATGEPTKISLSHMNLQSCRNCHFANSPSKYQFPSAEMAGPCGFGPANPSLTTEWAQHYFKMHGEKPFVESLGVRPRR
jgi:hypothetical protein